MSIELSHATSASNSAFRVVCGELIPGEGTFSHPEALFGYVRSGSATLETFDHSHHITHRDIYFIAPNTKYKISSSENLAIDVVTLNFSNPAALTQDYLPSSIIRALINGNCTSHAVIKPTANGYQEICNDLREVRISETEKNSYFQLHVYGKMYDVFFQLFSNSIVNIVDVDHKGKKYRALMRVTHYIDEHYSDGVSLDEVAGATGISRYYVSHLFKELMGTTFIGYVNELRLNHAAMLLLTTDNPIIEIAALSGFNNLSNFNRAFKLHFGKTPSVYRKG